MTIPFNAWVTRRILCDQPLNGELDLMSNPWKEVAAYLLGIPATDRQTALDGMLAITPRGDELFKAMLLVDPLGPAPQVQPISFATVADVRKIMANVRWLWDGWIPASRILGLASEEGVGKTRLAMDLCRRVYRELPWPDGQKMTLPPGAPSLWLPSDGQHDEIADMLPLFGLPDSEVIFPAPSDDPYANTSLDDPETRAQIDAAIVAHRPWALFVDSLTYATARDLCEQRSIAILKKPFVDLVQRHQIILMLLLHLSQEGQALGRRIKGITRTLFHLECPDPEKSERLRFWVEKSYGKKPPAMGVTMGDDGNDYDFNPPAKVDPNKGRKGAEKLDKAIAFITQKLTVSDTATVELVKEWEATGGSVGTFFNARKKMIANGLVVVDTSVKPQICHLVKP